MRKKLGPALGWVVATLASIALATSAVGSVRNEVTNQPSPLRATAETVAQLDPATTTVGPSGAPSTSAGSTTSSEATTVPSTTAATSTSSSTTTEAVQNATSSTTTTSTTAPPTTTTVPPTTSSTTTTAAPDDDYFETVQLIGGWVRLRVSGDKVFLAGSVPSPGFSMEIKEDGPNSVVVEFESDSHESKLHAEVEDGELDIETDEDEEH